MNPIDVSAAFSQLCSSRIHIGVAIAGMLCLSGCGGGSTPAAMTPPVSVNPPPVATPMPTPAPVPPVATLRGVVSGGHQPLSGAAVFVYRVGTSGYGSGAVILGTTATDSSGSWSVQFTQPADDPLIYVAAGGGANIAGTLLAAVGPLSKAPTQVTVNEVTTVASVYSLAQFLDAAQATSVGAPESNAIGLANAFGTVANLVNLSDGTPILTADAFPLILNPVTHASEATPGPLINTLANLLAACVGSSGPDSTACNSLFGLATPPGGTAPTDTRAALLDIALHPYNNVSSLFALSQTPATLFAPNLAGSEPNDWTLPINFSGGALGGSNPIDIAIDSMGDAWVTSGHCIPPPLTGGPDCVSS